MFEPMTFGEEQCYEEFRQACVDAFQGRAPKIRLAEEMERRGRQRCRVCAQVMEGPGVYLSAGATRLMHWECWEGLQDCEVCGYGPFQSKCKECRF